MTSCPECCSDNLEELGREDGGRQDDEHFVARTKFKCRNCGCEFEVFERFEVETEILTHGNQAEEEFEE